MDEPNPYDLGNPEQLITEIAARVELEEDSAWLALVHHPSSTQELMSVVRLPLPTLLDDDDDISDALCAATRALGVVHVRACPKHMVVTILVRPGYAHFGRNEVVWHKGWRYSNHCESVFSGGIILVTEHGWVDFLTDRAGHEPRLFTDAA